MACPNLSTALLRSPASAAIISAAPGPWTAPSVLKGKFHLYWGDPERGQVCGWEQKSKTTSGFGNLAPEPELTRLGCGSQQLSDAVFGAEGAEVTKAES